MNDNPPSLRPPFIAAVVSAVLHALLGIVLLIVMLNVVPGYKRKFIEYEMPLPWLTTFVISVSNWFAAYWYVTVIFALPLLALDGGIVFLCWQRRGTRILGVLWVLLVLLLWLLLVVATAVGIWLAYIGLLEGIAR